MDSKYRLGLHYFPLSQRSLDPIYKKGVKRYKFEKELNLDGRFPTNYPPYQKRTENHKGKKMGQNLNIYDRDRYTLLVPFLSLSKSQLIFTLKRLKEILVLTRYLPFFLPK